MGDPHSPLTRAENREKGEITLRNSVMLQGREYRKWRKEFESLAQGRGKKLSSQLASLLQAAFVRSQIPKILKQFTIPDSFQFYCQPRWNKDSKSIPLGKQIRYLSTDISSSNYNHPEYPVNPVKDKANEDCTIL